MAHGEALAITFHEEGAELLVEEWLFQAEGKPLDRRAAQEIAWARAIADRMVKTDRTVSLDAELTRLSTLEKVAETLTPEETILPSTPG